MTPELVVIIPVYNEEKIISTVIRDWSTELERLGINYLIKVYNDGSKDNTRDVLEITSSEFPKTVQIINKKNSGHGPTILEGYRNSLNAEWIFQVDSDNEMQAEHFNSLWKYREEFDFLIGKRINRKNNLVRGMMTSISHLVIGKYYGKGLTDVNCPYRLMRTNHFTDVINSIPTNTFAPNLIITGMSVKKGLRFKQIPIEFIERSTGESSLNSDFIKLFKIAYQSFQETISFARKNI